MGVNDRAQDRTDEKRARKRQRNLTVSEPVTVEDINGDTLLRCLFHVHEAGGAIRFGRTRDGGAWAIGVYGDGPAPYTEYVRPNEDINEYLRKLGESFAELNKK